MVAVPTKSKSSALPKVETPVEEAEVVVKKLVDTNVSNYDISKTEKGIYAKSSKTGEIFEGSIEDFNKALK